MMVILPGLKGQDHKLNIVANSKSPVAFFLDLSIQSGVNIIYNENLISKLSPITIQVENASLDDILQEALRGTDIRFRHVEDQIVLFEDNSPPARYSISGVVKDYISGEPLIYEY
jgi:hypothetical protein